MTKEKRGAEALLACLFVSALVGMLWLNACLPFVQMPSFHVAFWLEGFAQSFANNPCLAPYAHNFGYPVPQPLPFGLPIAWPMAFLLRVGLQPADTYSLVFAAWLCAAYVGCVALCRSFGISLAYSLALGFLWLTQPFVRGHLTGYTGVGIGFALLPTYLLFAKKVFDGATARLPARSCLFLLMCCVAIFMDGYSFILFAVASSAFPLVHLLQRSPEKRFMATRAFFYGLSFCAAYVVYKVYIGALPADVAQSSRIFHASGFDLSFFRPSQSASWLMNQLGLSIDRGSRYWGDRSMQTWYLPLLVAGFWGFWKSRKNALVIVFLCIALFAFWMSLGPVLKYEDLQVPGYSVYYPPENTDAYLHTGNWLLSKYLPGFKAMRAAYRWGIVVCLACWLAFGISLRQVKRTSIVLLGLGLLCLVTLPPGLGTGGIAMKGAFTAFCGDMLPPLEREIPRGALVAVIPVNNDNAINYLASRAGFIAYTVGGDKNNALCKPHWPEELRALPWGKFSLHAVVSLLETKKTDVVMVPFFNTFFWQWPLQPSQWYPDHEKWSEELAALDKEKFRVRIEKYFALVSLKTP